MLRAPIALISKNLSVAGVPCSYENAPPLEPVRLGLGPYDSSRRGAFSYERGTPLSFALSLSLTRSLSLSRSLFLA